MIVKRGDIVWLNEEIPYYELGGSVQSIGRPYIVISNNTNNTLAPTINVASISKQIRKSNYPMHVYLDKEKYGLEYNSVVFTEQVMTIPKDFIKTKIGSLDKEDMAKLNKAIFIQMIDETFTVEV